MENITPGTLAKLDRGLDWPDGTAARILAGTATKTEIGKIHVRGESHGGLAAALRLDASATGQANRPPIREEDEDALWTYASNLVPLLVRRAPTTPATLAALNALLHLMSEIAEGMSGTEQTDD